MRALRYAFLTAIVLVAVPALAGTRTGPGPFANIEVGDNQLVFDVRARGGKPLTAPAKVFAAVDVDWLPFTGQAEIQNNGARLVQRGTVGGLSIGEFFPEGQVRRLLVRDGSGSSTELDVLRLQTGFLQVGTNRKPEALLATLSTAVIQDFDATRDRSITLNLAPQSSPGYDVVIALRVPPLDEGINSQSVSVSAVDVSNGQRYFGIGGFASDGSVLYRHIPLPAGTYRLNVDHELRFGNPLVYAATLRFAHEASGTITVSPVARIFGFDVPADHIPAMTDVALTIRGIDQFNPSLGAPLSVNAIISAGDGRYTVYINRDEVASGSISATVPMLAGSFATNLGVARFSNDPNGVSHASNFGLDSADAAPEVTLNVPPLVRVTGSILDPNFVLVSSGEASNGVPTAHSIGGYAQLPNGTSFSGSSTVQGFARSFAFYMPKDSVSRLRGAFRIAVIESHKPVNYSRNTVGYLNLGDAAHMPVTFGDDVDVDVTVPAIPDHVTVTGRVLDNKGRPSQFAYVIASSLDAAGAQSDLGAVVTSRNDGTFTLRLPRSAHYTITAYSTLPLLY